jgi:hypothetical protein
MTVLQYHRLPVLAHQHRSSLLLLLALIHGYIPSSCLGTRRNAHACACCSTYVVDAVCIRRVSLNICQLYDH